MKTFPSAVALHLLLQAEHKLQDELDCIMRAFNSYANPSQELLTRGIEVEELLASVEDKLINCRRQNTKYFCVPKKIFHYLGTHHQY